MKITYSVGHTQASDKGTLVNLFSNYESRHPSKIRDAFVDANFGKFPTHRSCYVATCIAANGCFDTKFNLSVHFSEQVHLHALLMVLSTKNEHPGSVNTFDIYVIDEDLTETHCGTYETSGDRRGFEAWCNL